MSQLKYRPDIDGLRAIAILGVVGYHAFPASVPGGFIGVDVFFVISGFLISTIIFKQLEKGSFSLKQFYVRRIRRILPALILLTASIWLFGWYLLLPDEFRQLGKHIAGGNGFISNILLWGESGYFDTSSETKPLLHLWSLGIDEQFYFLWPISLGLVWRSRFSLLLLTLVVAISSFAANLFGLHAYSDAAVFYLPIFRFWELMIGGILAHVMMRGYIGQGVSPGLVNLQSVIGLAFIALAGAFLNTLTTFPGWWALLPTVGTFLLIAAPGAWINRRVLASRPMVYIGLISYPWYLWHWSILSFCHVVGFSSRGQMALGVVLSFLLAVLTYEFLEKAVKQSRKDHLVFSLCLMSFLLFCLGVFTYAGGLSPRHSSPGVKLAMEAVGDRDYPNGLTQADVENVQAYVKVGAEEKVLFYGDSHMEQFAPRIIKLIDEDPLNTKSAVFMTCTGCPPIPNVYEDKHPVCSPDNRAKTIQYALSPEIESVVIAFSSRYLLADEMVPVGSGHYDYHYYYLLDDEKIYLDEGGIAHALRALEEMLTSIARLKTVYLIIDNPFGHAFDPKNHFSGTRFTGFVDNGQRFQKLDQDQADLRDLMLEIAARSGAQVIDLVDFLCEDGQCRTTVDDMRPIYMDDSHLRPFFIREYVDILDVTVGR